MGASRKLKIHVGVLGGQLCIEHVTFCSAEMSLNWGTLFVPRLQVVAGLPQVSLMIRGDDGMLQMQLPRSPFSGGVIDVTSSPAARQLAKKIWRESAMLDPIGNQLDETDEVACDKQATASNHAEYVDSVPDSLLDDAAYDQDKDLPADESTEESDGVTDDADDEQEDVEFDGDEYVDTIETNEKTG